MNRLRLRPLGVGDIFDEGFDLYKRNFVPLLLATAAAVVPLDIGLAFLTPRFLPAVFSLLDLTTNSSDAFWVWLVANLVKILCYLPLYILAVGPVTIAASARYLGGAMPVETAFRQSLRRTPATLLATLLSGLLLALGMAFCGVLWLVAATQLLFLLQALLLEGLGPAKAMRRSGALGSGYSGRVFGCLLLLGLVLFVVSVGIRLPLSYLVDGILNLAPGASNLYSSGVGTAQQQVVTLISTGLAHLLLIPFVVCVVTVMYYDLRIRKEGVDIELLAQDLNYPPLSALGPYLPPVPVFGPGRPAMPPPQQMKGKPPK